VGGNLQLADLMPAKWLRSAAQVGSEGIWRQQQPGWPGAFLAVAWVAVGKILPHCSRGNRRLRMACARTDARSDGRLSSGAMAEYISFHTQASDRAPGRRARPLCLSGAALEPQRSRGAKLLHLSWEMRAGRATRVSRAGLARLISWRMNEFSTSRLQRRRRLCKRVADGPCIATPPNPHASGEAATTPESTNLRSNQPTGCVLLHEGCGKSYSRSEHLYRHQLNRKSAPLHLPACACA
jgi:hypothetical protein